MSSVASKRRGPASDRHSLRGRVAAIALLAALAGIPSGASGSTASAPGMQPPIDATLPAISGNYSEAQTLTADEGTWDGPDRNYEFGWVRCNSVGSLCDPVISATGQEYLLTAADVGSTVRVVVTATNKNGSAVATSDATPVIALSLPTTSTTTTSTATSSTTTTTTPTTTTTTTTTSPPSTSAYFSDGFESGFGNWHLEPSYSPTLDKSVPGFSGLGAGLVTTGWSYGPNADSEMTSMYLSPEACHAGWSTQRVLGQDSWYRVRVRFPTDYEPVTGDWNWIVEWHDDAVTSSYGAKSIAVGVYSDYPQVSGEAGKNPRLVLRLGGGSSTSPSYEAIELPSNSLVRDHWYDMVFHFVWHTNSSIGLAEWWLDGDQIVSWHFPTLFTNPDGTSSYNTCDLMNYHWAAPWTSEIDFDQVVIGPSRSSVGG
jgi:hypothetical protein